MATPILWLPLNDEAQVIHRGPVSLNNTRFNQGTRRDLIILEADTQTYEHRGKLGNCCHFNGSSAFLYTDGLYFGDTYSFTVWFYTNTNSGNQTIASVRTATGSGFSIFFIGNKLRIDPGGNGVQWTTSYTIPLNTWVHLAITYDGTKVSYYINGVFQQSYNTLINSIYWGNTLSFGASQVNGSNYGNYLNGNLNDIRIYNEVLSQKEIKEISQGLMLHYKLDGNGWGSDNLILNTIVLTPASSKTTKNCSVRGSATRQLRTDGFYEAKCTASWQGISTWSNMQNFAVGDKITYSFYIYGNGSSRAFSFYPMMYNSGGTRDTSIGLPISLDGGTYTTVNAKAFTPTTTTTPERHYATFEWNQSMKDILDAGGSIELSIQVHGTWNTGDWVCLFAPKLEKSEVPTPWCPNSADTIATTLNYNTTIENNTSGYNNNGIKNNITVVADSPRYLSSSNFNGTDSYIKVDTNSWMSQASEALTINLWAKATTWPTNGGRLISCTESGGFNLEAGNSGYWRFPVHVYTVSDLSTTAYKYDSNEIQISALTPNAWNMITLVYTTSGTKTYINGALHHTYTNTSYGIHFNTNAMLFLGCEAATANASTPYFNGQESDFRIYATALSDEDIKELYDTPTNIDKDGQFHTLEFIEDNGNSIAKNGLTHTNYLLQYIINYDLNIYTESDGTKWLHIAHHNNPNTNGYFSKNDNWENSIYIDSNKWFDMNICKTINSYEFMVKQKTTSDATETKYRWIQTKNPYEAVWADVQPNNVTRITTSGYTNVTTSGGIYKNNGNTYMVIANSNSGNWYGAIGSWTAYQNGIPGFPNTTVTTGYIDLFIRIDNTILANFTGASINKNGIYISNDFIEK